MSTQQDDPARPQEPQNPAPPPEAVGRAGEADERQERRASKPVAANGDAASADRRKRRPGRRLGDRLPGRLGGRRKTDAAAAPARKWRHTYSHEERRRILQSVLIESSDGWMVRFGVMMVCSVVIAALGLLSSSAAIVIGAMLIAPLMTPMQGVAVSLAMGWGRRLVTPGLTVLAATFGAIALAYMVSAIIPDPDPTALPAELLARTAPDLRDLLVAIGAGAAGAYATAREDVSAALPGVAVAVALVPPLSAVGITLQLDRPDLASGALLLYASNLVAIIGAAVIILLVTGFVPVPRLEAVKPRVVAGLAALGIALLIVGIPLTSSLVDATNRGRTQQRITDLVAAWLGPQSSLSIDSVVVQGENVVLDLAGPDNPPPARALADRLVDVLGDGVRVEVRWSLRSATITAVGGDQEGAFSQEDVRPVVLEWMQEDGEGRSLRLAGLGVQGTVITAEIVGPDEPPPAELLRTRLEEAVGSPERVDVRWTQQRQFTAAAGPEQTSDRALATSVVDGWLRGRGRLIEVDLSESDATISVASPERPQGLAALEEALSVALERRVEVSVRWTPEHTITMEDDRLEEAAAIVRARAGDWLAATPRTRLLSVTPHIRDGQAVIAVEVFGRDEPRAPGRLADEAAQAVGRTLVFETTWTGFEGTVSSAVLALPRSAAAVLEGDVLFRRASSRLRPESHPSLGAAAEAIRRDHPGKRIVVAGHTDDLGGEESNLRLSRRRAEAVRAWLISDGGIDPSLISVRAYGESRPIAPNQAEDGTPNADGMARNRRVELHIEP